MKPLLPKLAADIAVRVTAVGRGLADTHTWISRPSISFPWVTFVAISQQLIGQTPTVGA